MYVFLQQWNLDLVLFFKKVKATGKSYKSTTSSKSVEFYFTNNSYFDRRKSNTIHTN